MEINDFESTGGICDQCGKPIEHCPCEVHCEVCEDLMPRPHKHVPDKDYCSKCGQPLHDGDCEDYPANHFD
jgi:hypothetical protein